MVFIDKKFDHERLRIFGQDSEQSEQIIKLSPWIQSTLIYIDGIIRNKDYDRVQNFSAKKIIKDWKVITWDDNNGKLRLLCDPISTGIQRVALNWKSKNKSSNLRLVKFRGTPTRFRHICTMLNASHIENMSLHYPFVVNHSKQSLINYPEITTYGFGVKYPGLNIFGKYISTRPEERWQLYRRFTEDGIQLSDWIGYYENDDKAMSKIQPTVR
jgi:hypothetical protein